MALHVIATGGTIASIVDRETGAVRPAVGVDELLRTVPELDTLSPITAEEVDRVSGWNVTPTTMLEVARRAREALADDGVDGVVVTHGTDTVEETAFFCDVTVGSDKPIVFAAAMRSGDELGADGPRNLLCAAKVALDPTARGVGTVLVISDEVHAARWARKQDSFRVGAFASPGHGPIGFVTPSSVRLPQRSPRRWRSSCPTSWSYRSQSSGRTPAWKPARPGRSSTRPRCLGSFSRGPAWATCPETPNRASEPRSSAAFLWWSRHACPPAGPARYTEDPAAERPFANSG